jgi:glycosyltransferase involved in cell wall biosynthesis
MVYIESSFWRVKDPANASVYSRARGRVLEFLYRQCVKAADLRFFTSNKYLQEFLKPDARAAYVRHASWIDDGIILDEKSAIDGWERKNGRLRFLFAGRLTADKGISLLLEAAQRTAVELAIIGDGPMREQCSAAVREKPSIRLLPPIPYGDQFFRLVREFDAVIVPSISDEQPRIIFDAFSQAVPVIGADTSENGVLFARGDAAALSAVLESVSRDGLKGMGLRALSEARSRTHRSMHEERSHLIASHAAGIVLQQDQH